MNEDPVGEFDVGGQVMPSYAAMEAEVERLNKLVVLDVRARELMQNAYEKLEADRDLLIADGKALGIELWSAWAAMHNEYHKRGSGVGHTFDDCPEGLCPLRRTILTAHDKLYRDKGWG